jgi:hypothetical protein
VSSLKGNPLQDVQVNNVHFKRVLHRCTAGRRADHIDAAYRPMMQPCGAHFYVFPHWKTCALLRSVRLSVMFVYSVVCVFLFLIWRLKQNSKTVNPPSFRSLTINPQSLLKRVMQKLGLCVPSFNFHYSLVSLGLSGSFIRLRHLLPFTSILPSILPSITCFRSHFLRHMRTIQLTFLLLSYVRYSSPPWLCIILLHFSHYRSNWSSPTFSSTTLQKFRGIFYLSELSNFQHQRKLCSEQWHFASSFRKFKSNLLVQRFFVLLKAAFVSSILDLISYLQLAPFVIITPSHPML